MIQLNVGMFMTYLFYVIPFYLFCCQNSIKFNEVISFYYIVLASSYVMLIY